MTEIKVGQVWWCRDGSQSEILETGPDLIRFRDLRGGHEFSWVRSSFRKNHPRGLVRDVQAASAAAPLAAGARVRVLRDADGRVESGTLATVTQAYPDGSACVRPDGMRISFALNPGEIEPAPGAYTYQSRIGPAPEPPPAPDRSSDVARLLDLSERQTVALERLGDLAALRLEVTPPPAHPTLSVGDRVRCSDVRVDGVTPEGVIVGFDRDGDPFVCPDRDKSTRWRVAYAHFADTVERVS
jgi:hypothetical protein